MPLQSPSGLHPELPGQVVTRFFAGERLTLVADFPSLHGLRVAGHLSSIEASEWRAPRRIPRVRGIFREENRARDSCAITDELPLAAHDNGRKRSRFLVL